MSRITVLISGSGSNLQALIDAQHQGNLSNAQIVSVISSSKNAYGLTRAREAGIPARVHSLYSYTQGIPRDDKDARSRARIQFEDDLAEMILGDKPDLVICAGWLLILGPEFLTRVKTIPILNLHPALPGAFDGTTHAIELAWRQCQDLGEPVKSGCMVHYVVEEVDRGKPIVVKELEIVPGMETLEEYEARVHALEHKAIVEAVKQVIDELNKQ